MTHIYGKMASVKTTLEIRDDLFRASKARAALRGQSLKDFVCDALESHITETRDQDEATPGWRKVFGSATADDVATVDAVIDGDLETVNPSDWRE